MGAEVGAVRCCAWLGISSAPPPSGRIQPRSAEAVPPHDPLCSAAAASCRNRRAGRLNERRMWGSLPIILGMGTLPRAHLEDRRVRVPSLSPSGSTEPAPAPRSWRRTSGSEAVAGRRAADSIRCGAAAARPGERGDKFRAPGRGGRASPATRAACGRPPRCRSRDGALHRRLQRRRPRRLGLAGGRRPRLGVSGRRVTRMGGPAALGKAPARHRVELRAERRLQRRRQNGSRDPQSDDRKLAAARLHRVIIRTLRDRGHVADDRVVGRRRAGRF